MPTDPRRTSPLWWVVATAAFVVELLLVGTVARASYRFADGGPLGWLAGVLAAAVLIAVWATWMSPKAPRRLGRTGRLVLGSALVVVTAGMAYAGGLHAWAWWLGVGGVVVVLVSQWWQE